MLRARLERLGDEFDHEILVVLDAAQRSEERVTRTQRARAGVEDRLNPQFFVDVGIAHQPPHGRETIGLAYGEPFRAIERGLHDR